MAKRQDGPEKPGDKNRPAHEVKIGRIRCTLWENQSAEQGTWYSMTFTRSYKDGQGQWKTAQSFGRDDLLVLAEAARLAYLWIARQQGGTGLGEDGQEPEQGPQ